MSNRKRQQRAVFESRAQHITLATFFTALGASAGVIAATLFFAWFWMKLT